MKPTEQCRLPDTYSTLEALVDVISNKDSVGQVERQLILMDIFLNATGDKINLVDLQLVSRVMRFFMARLDNNTHYRLPFQKMLNLLKGPPVMQKSSDELYYKHHLVELFTTLGCVLLKTKNKDQKVQVLEIVQNILLGKRDAMSGSVPIKACVQGIEVSDFMECLADFLAIADDDLYYWTIYTALQICSISEFGCWTLLTKGVMEILFVRLTMAKEHERQDILDISWQLLWKLLSCTNHTEDWKKVPVPSRIALHSLRYIHREEALIHAHPGRNINGLNNIAALILKLFHIFPQADYIMSGLLEDIVFSATLTESVLPLAILPYFKNEICYFQYKKIMLACLSLCPPCNLRKELFEQYKVAECLVIMLSGKTPCGCKNLWCTDHAINMFYHVLPIVCTLYDCLYQRFIDSGLMKQLLQFLKVHYLNNKKLPDDLTEAVVKTILSISSRKGNQMDSHNALRQAEAIPILLTLCTRTLQLGNNLTIRFQTILHVSLCVLTLLLENKTHLQEEYYKHSHDLVITLFKRILKPLKTDTLTDNRLIVAICYFAWEVLVWNKKNALHFISSDEMYSVIDILEKSSFSVQLVYLSMLVDICEHHQSIPYLVSWRGSKGQNFVSLLCKIWRREENTLKVPRDEEGCILDVERPLMGETQFVLSKKNKNKIISICDVFASFRPKIYAILQLFHRHKSITDICEEHYKLGFDKVPFEDQVTLKCIETYLPLKMGEIWWEIYNKQKLVLPLDRYLAETLNDRYLNWSLNVQRAQHSILKKKQNYLRCGEEQYYSLVRSTQLTSALNALQEVMMIARTTDRQILLTINQKLRDDIEASRAKVDTDIQVTYPRDFNVILINDKTDLVMKKKSEHIEAE